MTKSILSLEILIFTHKYKILEKNPLPLDAGFFESPIPESEIYEDYINVFLPTDSPRWDYYFGKIIGKSIYLKRSRDDQYPEKVLDLMDYKLCEQADYTVTARKNSVRLLRFCFFVRLSF